MKAIILAGGEGKRLRPITCTMPKPMVPLLNRPIIDYIMDLISEQGFDEAIFTLRYMSNRISEHIGDGSRWGIRAAFCDPGRALGTAGSVRAALNSTNETVVILSGDGITDVDLKSVLKAHNESAADATIVLTSIDEPTEYGVALIDREGYITRFIEKPERGELFSDYANTGIYVLSPKALDLIPLDKEFDFSKDLFPLMLEKGMKLLGYRSDAYWCDIGDIAQYRRAQRDILDGKCSCKLMANVRAGVCLEPDALVAESAKLIPPCYIGKNAVIGEGALVGPYCVVGSGTVVEEAADMKRTVLFNCVHVRRSAQLRDTVVCENAVIGSDACLYSGSTIGAGTHIGDGAEIKTGVSVWPDKVIEAGTVLSENLVWSDSVKRVEFSESSALGAADSTLTPETAVRIGAAFASALTPGGSIAIATDGSLASVMLKQALIAGIISQGTDAVSLTPTSKHALRFTVSQTGYNGGIYVKLGGDRRAELVFITEDGIEAPGSVVRNIRTAFNGGELKPALGRDLGIMTAFTGFSEAYEHFLFSIPDQYQLMLKKSTLILDAPEQTRRIIARVLSRCGWEVESADGRNKPQKQDQVLYIALDEKDRLGLMLSDGSFADNEMLLTVLAKRLIETNALTTAVLPTTLPEEYRAVLEKSKCSVIYAKQTPSVARRAAKEMAPGCMLLFEPEAAIIKLCEMFVDGSLEKELASLPKFAQIEETVASDRTETARILRKLSEQRPENAEAELIDGLRIKLDSGWVVVQPQSVGNASFRIIAGSSDSEYAKELCDIYCDRVKRMQQAEEITKNK